MSILLELHARFAKALQDLVPAREELAELLAMIRRSQDPKFGDYQANFAMPLGKRLGRPPRDVAAEAVARLDLGDFCLPAEIAGPGFINLRVRDEWIAARLAAAVADDRLGIPAVASPRTFVVDYSAPNVAKPMHVGHIRSTVIGDSLVRVLRFLGHRAISDNHIGDWGTQFGMILYGYKHYLDEKAYRQNPVEELARLYRLVRRLIDYHEGRQQLAPRQRRLDEQQTELAGLRAAAPAPGDKKAEKEWTRQLRRLETAVAEAKEELAGLKAKLAEVDNDPTLSRLAAEDAAIGSAVLEETARLHAGDAENLRLWREFLPASEAEMQRMYQRLGVTFDHTLGESFYHNRLAPTVEELLERGIAQKSEGAVCIFLEGIDAPMIIRKKDGAFLYGTTDLATLRYRVETFQPDAILYVVGDPQRLHFQQLFGAARRMGYDRIELEHVSFGSVLGEDNRPFKTRAGDTVGLEGLLDEAVRRAAEVVANNDDAKPNGPELASEERRRIAGIVGIGALKYADLSQNRTSDYVFSYDKMLAMNGNTATYMQYAYARVRSIFAKGKVDIDALRASGSPILFSHPAERALGLELLRFAEAIEMVVDDYRPNQLTAYLFDLANRYSTFYEHCPVLTASPENVRHSRLLLCDLTARTIGKGLELLGIDVVERM